MDGVGDYRRQRRRRQRRRRQRRIILGVMVLLLVAIVMAVGLGISSYNKRKKQQAWITEGTEYLDQGNYDGAIQAFDEALDIFKGKTGKTEQMVLQYRAEAEYSKEDYQMALATCEKLIAAGGEKDDYRKIQSLCQMKLGDYEAALTFAPHAAIIYNRMAKEAIDEQRYEDALAAVTKGMETADSAAMAELAFTQADAYEKSGDFAKALELFEAYNETYGPDQTAEKEITFLRSRQGNNNGQ